MQNIKPGKTFNNESLNPLYRNFVFVSIAEVDQESFQGSEEMEQLRISAEEGLKKYVQLVKSYGLTADYRMDAGTDVVDTAARVCESLAKEFPRSMVFTGKLIFHEEHFFQKLLHNETAHAIQRRLQWNGIETVVLPIRI